MRPLGLMNDEGRVGLTGYRIPLALTAAAISAALTLAVEKLSAISESPIIGAAQHMLFALLFPGIFGSMAISGNAHAWHLWIAAGINGLVYWGLAWLACRLVSGFTR